MTVLYGIFPLSSSFDHRRFILQTVPSHIKVSGSTPAHKVITTLLRPSGCRKGVGLGVADTTYYTVLWLPPSQVAVWMTNTLVLRV